jgi:hypothetical protein
MTRNLEHHWEAVMRKASRLKLPQSRLLSTYCAALFTGVYAEFCGANAWPHADQFQEILAKLWAGGREPGLETSARRITPDVDAFEAVEASYACNAGIVLALAAAREPDASGCVEHVWSTADLMLDCDPEVGDHAIKAIEEAFGILTGFTADGSAALKILAEKNQLSPRKVK